MSELRTCGSVERLIRALGVAFICCFLFTLSAEADFVSYQKGDGKGTVSETDDVTLDETQPDTNLDYPNENPAYSCVVDNSNHQHCLLKFPNIFGNGSNQIPLGSVIINATLIMYQTDPGQGGVKCPTIYQVTDAWTEAEATWNDRQTGVPWTDPTGGADGPLSRSTNEGIITCDSGAGVYETHDVTASVQNWSNGEANHGWVFTNAADNNGIDYRDSEYTDVAQRPELQVTYIPNVFYSVGTNSSDLKAGSPTITVANGVATLDVGQTNEIGVGDVIDHDTDNKLVYISHVVSPSEFHVRTSTGALPTNVSGVAVNSIKRAFNSIAQAVTESSDGSHLGNTSLVAAGRGLSWVCYDDSAFDVSATTTITGYTTDASHFITLTVAGALQVATGNSQRHNGIAGTGTRMEVTSGSVTDALDIDIPFTRIEWLEIDGNDNTTVGGILLQGTADNVLLRSLIIHNVTSDGVNVDVGADDAEVRNVIVYDYGLDGVHVSGTNATISNSTFYLGRTGPSNSVQTDTGAAATAQVYNVLAVGPETDFWENTAGGLSLYNCISTDSSACDFDVSGNCQTGIAEYTEFVSAVGTIDLHLRRGAEAIDFGMDLSSSFGEDIDEDERPQGAAWDAGADESFFSGVTTYYRSIGTAADLVDAGPITVTAGSALVTKSGGPGWLAQNRGRGDVLIVGGNNYMIASVDSDDTLSLATLPAVGYSGAYTIARQFSTLEGWEDCIDGQDGSPPPAAPCYYFPAPTPSLLADDRREVGIAYDDATPSFLLTGSVQIQGSTTDGSHTILLTADPGNRHNGVAGAGVVVDANLGGNEFDIRDSNVTVEWLEFVRARGDNIAAIQVWSTDGDLATNVVLQNLLIHDFGDKLPDVPDSSGIDLAGDNTLVGKSMIVRNTMIWDGDQYGIEGDGTLDTALIENVSIDGMSERGIYAASGPLTVRNTIVTSSPLGDFVPGSGSLSGSNNTSSDDTATFGANAQTFRLAATLYVTPNSDLHLKSAPNVAIDTGMDLSSSFSFDVDGQLRPAGAGWDRGADELGATTAVELLSFEASPSDAAVDLAWTTGSEMDNLGFNLHRSLSTSGPWERITPSLIPGLGSSPEGASYTYRDTGLINGVTYYYRLEDIEATGATHLHGPVWATPHAGAGTENEGAEDGVRSRITVGDPMSNRWNILRERSSELVLELITEGFYATPQDDGTVRLEIPGFVLTEEADYPRLPVKRAWVPILANQNVSLVSIEAFGEESFNGLHPEQVGTPAVEATRRGTVRAAQGRRPQSLASARGLYPSEAARLLSLGFQADQKKALVEMAPLRWDSNRRRLVLSNRLVMRLALVDLEPANPLTGNRRSRRYLRPASNANRLVVSRWVTKEEGLYGVDIGSLLRGRSGPSLDPSSFRLSRQGETVPYHVQGATLYFVSVGADANPYGNEAVYELEIGAPGERMATGSAVPSGASAGDYWEVLSKEEDQIYQAVLVNAPDRWLWSMLFAPARESFRFEISAPSSIADPPRLSVWLQGGSDFGADPDHHVRLYVNGQFVGEESWNGKQLYRIDADLGIGLLIEGDNDLEVENVGDTEAAYSMVMLDRFQVRYARTTEAVGGILEGSWSRSGAATVSGVGPDAIIIATDASGPVWLTGAEPTASGLRFQAEANRSYLAVDRDRVSTVETRRLPADKHLKTIAQGADYLMVGPRDFLSAVRTLVDLRRSQGLRVKVVAVEDVFSEFGFGEGNPKAIRDFLAYAYHNWEQAPRFVLLLGDGTFDFKDRLGTGVQNHVPPLMVTTTYLETASDPTYAAVNGEDMLPDLAIGRLPASTVEELQRMVDKIVLWETSGNSLRGRVVLVTDDPDGAGDFMTNAETLAHTVLATRETLRIYLGALSTADTRDAIRAAFDGGASLMSYIGHGGIHLWADEDIFNVDDVKILSSQPEQPMLLTMNCLNGYFHFPYFDALAEQLLLADGKGVIAAFSPSGLSLDNQANLYHQALLQALVNGGHERLGDAILDAQQVYAETGALPELLSIYHLFGDPALTLR